MPEHPENTDIALENSSLFHFGAGRTASGAGGWFTNQIIAEAVRDYAYCSGFRPHRDGSTANDVLHNGK